MKKNIIIAILAIISLGLVSYIVYDKMSDKKNENNDNNINYNDKINNDSERINVITFGNLEDLITNIDKEKINNSNNFQNVKIRIGDLDLTFNCNLYGEPGGEYCWNTHVLLNNKEIFNYGSVVGAINSNPYIIVTDKYLIIQEKDIYQINIYDKNGNKLKEIEKVVYSFSEKEAGSKYVELPMFINKNKLYFLTYQYDGDIKDFSYRNYNKIQSNYIDLNNSNFEIVDNNVSFEAKIACKEC